MRQNIYLNNNYYFNMVEATKKLPINAIDITKLNVWKILKQNIVLLKIDFKTLTRKEYKKILKRLLLLKNIASKTNKRIGKLENSKILLGYLINYDMENEQYNEFLSCINAIFYSTRYERYNYIYDTVCDYLDSYFYGKNLCDFKSNQCGEKKGTTSYIGCCHHYKNKLFGPLIPHNLVSCEYLKEDHTCGAKCISCKLFTCDYLEKKGVKFKIKDILLLNVFFNPLQKYFIKFMVYTPKDKVIKRLMRII